MVRIKVDDGNQEDCGKKKLYHFESEREISSKKFNFNSNVVKNIEGGNTFSPLKLESRKKWITINLMQVFKYVIT